MAEEAALAADSRDVPYLSTRKKNEPQRTQRTQRKKERKKLKGFGAASQRNGMGSISVKANTLHHRRKKIPAPSP
ncbi:MAG: hypothetical protein V7L05_11110 [Nostoc sp.]|uniref:hypothetical protein n=1 Tax=Nostoc sp. TaxID=1180 RepID=UPI002FF6B064